MRWVPGLQRCVVPSGRVTSASVPGATSASRAKVSSTRCQDEATWPWGVWRRASAEVRPPPGRGRTWKRRGSSQRRELALPVPNRSPAPSWGSRPVHLCGTAARPAAIAFPLTSDTEKEQLCSRTHALRAEPRIRSAYRATAPCDALTNARLATITRPRHCRHGHDRGFSSHRRRVQLRRKGSRRCTQGRQAVRASAQVISRTIA